MPEGVASVWGTSTPFRWRCSADCFWRFAETADVTLDFAHVEKLLGCALGKQTRAELPRGWLASCTRERLELHPPQPDCPPR